MYEEFLEKELLTVDEVMDILCLGRNTVYDLLRTGTLQGVKFGKVWRVPKENIRLMILEKMQSQ